MKRQRKINNSTSNVLQRTYKSSRLFTNTILLTTIRWQHFRTINTKSLQKTIGSVKRLWGNTCDNTTDYLVVKFVQGSFNHVEFLFLNCLLKLLTLELSLLIKFSTLFNKFLTLDRVCICSNIVTSAFNIKHTSFVLFIYLSLILTQSQVLYSKLGRNVRGFNIRKYLFSVSYNKITRLYSILCVFFCVLCISVIVLNNRVSLLYLYICQPVFIVLMSIGPVVFLLTKSSFLQIVTNVSKRAIIGNRGRRKANRSARSSFGSINETTILRKWIYASSFEPFKLGARVIISILSIELLLPVVHFHLALHLHELFLTLILLFRANSTEDTTEEAASSTTHAIS